MPLYRFEKFSPKIDPSAWIAPSAELIGRVFIGPKSSIWYGSVLRGDINEIHIGAESNVQDNSVIHLSDTLPTLIGDRVTVGHKALLHACTIGDETLVGMGAIIMDGANIGAQSIIGAGALVTGGTVTPPGSLILGSPAKVIRPLTPEERHSLPSWAAAYTSKLDRYRQNCEQISL